MPGCRRPIDISADAVERIRANAIRNGVPHLQAREANVFDELRRLERAGERFDTIVLDPPAFAKNKAAIPNALAGYKEINLRAMRLLSPGGYLVTCSCSYNVSEELFAETIHEASIDSRTPVTLVEKRMQGRDHPVLVGVPETHYLKCMVLEEGGIGNGRFLGAWVLGCLGSGSRVQGSRFFGAELGARAVWRYLSQRVVAADARRARVSSGAMSDELEVSAIGAVAQMIGGLHQRTVRHTQVLSNLAWLIPSESFGDVAWSGCRRVANLIAELDVPGHLTASNQARRRQASVRSRVSSNRGP